MSVMKGKLIFISIFVFLVALFYWLLPSNIVFANDDVTVYIENYGAKTTYITEKTEKKKILNAISDINISKFKNQHLLFADDGITITVYGKGIQYGNKDVGVIHIYISDKNEINTIQIGAKEYSFKKENTLLKEYL